MANNELSPYRKVEYGIPQGSILGLSAQTDLCKAPSCKDQVMFSAARMYLTLAPAGQEAFGRNFIVTWSSNVWGEALVLGRHFRSSVVGDKLWSQFSGFEAAFLAACKTW